MSIPSANGGYVSIGAGGGNTQHVARWTGDWMNRLAEVTTSAYGGAQYTSALEDPSWSFEVPRDSTAFPEALNFKPGYFFSDIWFKLGADTVADRVSNTTVERVSKENNNAGEVVRITVSGRGGKVLFNQALPS